MTRRDFFRRATTAAAVIASGAVLEPNGNIWLPNEKLIDIPKPKPIVQGAGWIVRELSVRHPIDGRTQVRVTLQRAADFARGIEWPGDPRECLREAAGYQEVTFDTEHEWAQKLVLGQAMNVVLPAKFLASLNGHSVTHVQTSWKRSL